MMWYVCYDNGLGNNALVQSPLITVPGLTMPKRIVSILLLLLAACSSESPEEYIGRAHEAMGKSEYAAASIELKNALRLEPDSMEARWLLGKVYLETGDMASASKELKRALELGGAPDDIVPSLAEALLAQGEYQQVQDISTQGLTAEALAGVLAMQAQAAMVSGDTWQAEELIDKALKKMPSSAAVLLAKARILATRDDVKGASQVLDQLLELEPENAQAWSLKGDIRDEEDDLQGALEAYSKAVSLTQNNISDLMKRSLVHLRLGDYEAAQVDARNLLGRSPKHAGANYVQGLLHFQAGRYADAITSLSANETMFEVFPMSQFYLAGANLKEGHVDLAAKQAELFHGAWPEIVAGRKLLASIRLGQGEYAEVRSLLQPVLVEIPDDIDALNLMSNALLREGKMQEGIAMLSRVATLQPDSAGAQIRLGAGLFIEGDEDAAVKHIEAALELDPQFEQADILLVLNYLRKGDNAAALTAAQSYLERHNDSVTSHNLLGKVYLDTGDPEQARIAFQGALAIDKADPSANHFLAQMALESGEVAGARKFYEAALAGHPDSVPTLINLATLDAREGDDKAMIAHLEQAKAADPTALQPRLMLARLFLARNKPDQVAPLFSDLDPSNRQSPEVLPLMAMAQLATKDPTAAQYTLEQLLKSTPDSAVIRHAMAMAAAGQGDSARAIEELRRSIALDEKNVQSRLALARLAVVTNDNEEFERQLTKLEELAPEDPDVLLLKAASAQRSGDLEKARELAAKAFSLVQSAGTVVALANYEEAGGDREGAQRLLADWLRQKPGDVAVRMAYAASLQVGAMPEQAAQQYAEVVKLESRNLVALNNLAWLIREKEPVQALDYARRAAELAPDSAEVLDTLAVVEYLNKDYRRAERSIDRALNQQPDNPSLLYHSAMIDVALEDESQARATLEELLESNAEFPELAEAKALLAQLTE
jgi:cellulose synthase operon protein C